VANKKRQAIFSLALTLALAILAGLYAKNHWAEFKTLLATPIWLGQWVAIFASMLLTLVINSELLRTGVRVMGVPLGFKEGLALAMSTMGANYFIPLKGGAGLRAYYLKARWKMPFTDFIAQLFAISVVALAVGSFLAFWGLWFMAGTEATKPLLGYFGGTFILGLASIMFLGRIPLTDKVPRLAALARGWDVFRANPKVSLWLALLQVAYYLVLALVNRLCFEAFGVSLGWGQALFYSAVQLHSTIINLTPAGLGVVEAFGVLAGQVLNFTPAVALLAQGLYRLSQLTLLILIGLWGWRFLARGKTLNSVTIDGEKA
jgi:uncharacterized membrane protein YbhN (UPF0104 family)